VSTPQNATEVAQSLGQLAVQLDHAVRDLARLDEESVRARARYEVLFAKEFLTGAGSVDARKQAARIVCEKEWLDAEIADQRVRSQKAMISALGVRIDVGRSYGSAIKAEMQLVGTGNAA
jgi:hypothetical protein